MAASIFAADTFAADTNGANTASQDALLQIQEQLQAAQLAIAGNRAQAQAEAATNAAALTAKIQSLEQQIADQRAGEIEAARKTQQLTLFLGAAFALAGLGVMLLIFYLQWRAFSQFAKISARQLAAFERSRPFDAAGQLTAEISAPSRVTVENSNARLIALVQKLESRVAEMEHSAREQLSQPSVAAPKDAVAENGVAKNGHLHERVAGLLSDGQTLLNAAQPENALKFFDDALKLDEKSAVALIKKAGALERINRIDDALACYDRAIELGESATMAWLQKGGLFNRLARYEEAMKCYEEALRAQEKKTVS